MLDALTIPDLQLGLRDFFQTRVALVQGTAAGNIFLQDLQARRDALEALPPVLTGSRPEARPMREVDVLHDGKFRSLRTILDGALLDPELPAAERTLIRKAIDTYLADVKAGTQSSYASQAASAAERSKLREAQRDELASLTLVGGRSLYSGLVRMHELGNALDEKLRARVQAETDAARTEARELRGSTIRQIGAFETTLMHEVDLTPSLPRDLVQRAFGYFHELAAMRDAQDRADDAGPAAPPQPPAPPQSPAPPA